MEELLSAIDERTLIVPISHVLFRSSGVKDVPAIVKRAHEVGALVMLDCYQSAGVMPVKLAEWGVDIACGGSVKWACGGPGAAWIYVAPEILPKLRPMQTGWLGHKRPFAFEMDAIDHADDIFRVVGGTPAIPALYTARAGWELIRKVGVDAIRKKSLRQTTLLRNLVEERGFRINTPREDDERGGTICFDFDGAERVSITARTAACERARTSTRRTRRSNASSGSSTSSDGTSFEPLGDSKSQPATLSAGAIRWHRSSSPDPPPSRRS